MRPRRERNQFPENTAPSFLGKDLAAAFPHQLNDKPRDMALRHKALHIRRQEQCLIDIPAAKIFAHGPRLNQTRLELNSDYSDRLLTSRWSEATQAASGAALLSIRSETGDIQCRNTISTSSR